MDLLHGLSDLLHLVHDWTVGWAATPWATWALFLIAFAESSFFPIPPDVLLIPMAFGAVANDAPERAILFAFVVTLGSVLGGIFGYGLGRWGGHPLLRRFFSPEKVLTVQNYYQRWDIWAVGLAGFTPIPYKLFSISAGAFHLDFRRFVVATVAGRGARFFLVAVVIVLFGPAVEHLIDQYLEVAALAFAALLVGGFWLVGFMSRRVASGAPPPGDDGVAAAPSPRPGGSSDA